jgi:hypothetical protein
MELEILFMYHLTMVLIGLQKILVELGMVYPYHQPGNIKAQSLMAGKYISLQLMVILGRLLPLIELGMVFP